jgi:hypothetical protein
MKQYLVAAVLIASFATPALAEQFWVSYDGKRCEMFSHKPKDSMNISAPTIQGTKPRRR